MQHLVESPGGEVAYNPQSKTFRVRYLCPWCSENSNVAAAHGVNVPHGRVALLVVCEGNRCLHPSMVIVLFHNDRILGETIFVEGIHPGRRELYKPPGVPEDIA